MHSAGHFRLRIGSDDRGDGFAKSGERCGQKVSEAAGTMRFGTLCHDKPHIWVLVIDDGLDMTARIRASKGGQVMRAMHPLQFSLNFRLMTNTN